MIAGVILLVARASLIKSITLDMTRVQQKLRLHCTVDTLQAVVGTRLSPLNYRENQSKNDGNDQT